MTLDPFDPRTIDFDAPCRIWLSRERITLVSAEDADLARDMWQFHRDQRGRPYVYRQIAACGNRVGLYLHRAVMLRISEPPTPQHVVDHISGNSLDNRRRNLRWASPSENRCNSALFGLIEEVDWLGAMRRGDDFMTIAETTFMKFPSPTAPPAAPPSGQPRQEPSDSQTEFEVVANSSAEASRPALRSSGRRR